MFVKDELYDERIKICRSCEHLQKKLGVETCKLCGCVMPLKARFRATSCPDNPPKWNDDLDIWEKELVFYEEDDD